MRPWYRWHVLHNLKHKHGSQKFRNQELECNYFSVGWCPIWPHSPRRRAKVLAQRMCSLPLKRLSCPLRATWCSKSLIATESTVKRENTNCTELLLYLIHFLKQLDMINFLCYCFNERHECIFFIPLNWFTELCQTTSLHNAQTSRDVSASLCFVIL